jgi:frataxin-like iron-binding protein CyaY
MESLLNVVYEFTKENMHKSRISISVDSKIMINSQDVHFGITRQCAQVGLKNMNIFNKKNHLWRSARNGKTFLERDLHHNFVQLLAWALVMT